MREVAHRFAVGLAAAVWIACLGGCATFPPPKEKIPNTRAYAYGFETVWDAVLDSLSEQNIATTATEKKTGTIVAEDRSIELNPFEPGRYDSKYCYCGPPQRGTDFRRLIGTYVVMLAGEGDQRTSVKIDAAYRASMYAGDALADWLPCPSKGIFEPFFLDRVEARLAARNQPAPPPKEPEPLKNIDHWWKPSWER